MSSTGPNICGTGADDGAVGTVSWSSPGSITSNDGVHASATGGGSAVSHYLKATNFGFALGTTEAIDGITFDFERHSQVSPVSDSAIRVIKGGSISSHNQSAGATWSSSAGTVDTIGSPSTLWGETWLYSDINASTFGVALSVQLSSGMTIANVDHVDATVYHHIAGFDADGTMAHPAFAWWWMVLEYARINWPERRRRFAMATISQEITSRRLQPWEYFPRPQTPGERYWKWAAAIRRVTRSKSKLLQPLFQRTTDN